MVKITGTGLLSLITPVAGTITGIIQAALKAVVDPVLNAPESGLLIVAGNALSGAATALAEMLSPVFALINSVVAVNINVQQDDEDNNTFTEIPVQLSLLSDSMTFNLGKVVAGANVYTA